MARAKDDDTSLKRLGGGRWQTRDERFTIEPQSGTWVVVDAEQTDDLGLPLVRGPFGSLGDAKTAIAAARTSEPVASPLSAKVAGVKGGSTPSAAPSGPGGQDAGDDGTAPGRKAGAKRSADEAAGADAEASAARAAEPPAMAEPKAAAEPEPPAEPAWLTSLEPADRRRARRLIEALTKVGAPDPEGIVRRDLVGDVPATAAVAVARAVRALGSEAAPADVVRLLVDGRDQDLDVRWRLVDGAGRPISVDIARLTDR